MLLLNSRETMLFPIQQGGTFPHPCRPPRKGVYDTILVGVTTCIEQDKRVRIHTLRVRFPLHPLSQNSDATINKAIKKERKRTWQETW